ncbi:MAG: multicopper oxidase domain-containing protein [Specibacter sp.]
MIALMSQFLNRRAFIGLSVEACAAVALAACTPATTAESVARVLPTDPLIAEYESHRQPTGKVVGASLTAAPSSKTPDIKTLQTWGYNDSFTGPTLRANVGDRIKSGLSNKLSEPTSIHWHGLALRNNQDGVPGLTEEAPRQERAEPTISSCPTPAPTGTPHMWKCSVNARSTVH